MLLRAGTATGEQLQEILSDIRRDDLRAHEVIRRLRALLEKHEVEQHRVAPARGSERSTVAARARGTAARREHRAQLRGDVRRAARRSDPAPAGAAESGAQCDGRDGADPPPRRAA